MARTPSAVEVAVVLVGRRGQLLADFNPHWGFTLPMTKLREKPGKTPKAKPIRETPLEAACRAAAEVLGRPLAKDRLPVAWDVPLPPWQQSERDGAWRRYQFHVFALPEHGDVHPTAGHSITWLSPTEFLTNQPISPTAAHIVKTLGEEELVRRFI